MRDWISRAIDRVIEHGYGRPIYIEVGPQAAVDLRALMLGGVLQSSDATMPAPGQFYGMQFNGIPVVVRPHQPGVRLITPHHIAYLTIATMWPRGGTGNAYQKH